MPLTIAEKVESRKWMTGSNASIELAYSVLGTDDETAAKDAVGPASPTSFNGPTRRTVELEPV